jgi:hypothetical protein
MQTYHEASQRERGRDLAFWKDFGDPWEARNNSNKGLFFEEEFIVAPTMASATAQGGYLSYQDTGGTIKPKATLHGGIWELATDGTDEDEVWVQAVGPAGHFSATAGRNHDQWFESIQAVDRITANAVSYQWGLAAAASAVADHLVDATGALQTARAVVGFHSLPAAPETLRAVYNTASGTVVSLGTAATLVAGTFVRTGIRYRKQTGKCEWWVNGVRMFSLAISTANFPDAIDLSPMWGFKSTTATVSTLDLDSWRYGLIW